MKSLSMNIRVCGWTRIGLTPWLTKIIDEAKSPRAVVLTDSDYRVLEWRPVSDKKPITKEKMHQMVREAGGVFGFLYDRQRAGLALIGI
jgi:3,4-dihydroxy-2-butanone 4-phosphate synthase